ncbi:MAG: ATP-binding protein [Candidatus Altiarchaeota archaeon]
MDSVGMVQASSGRRVTILVTDGCVELGCILRIGDFYGIVASMAFDEDDKIGSKQKLIAEVDVFGRMTDRGIKKIKKPVEPYESVFLAQKDELEKMLSSQAKKISIGKVYGTDARAYLNPYEYDRHMAILASTGSGKSYTAANLIKEFVLLGLPVVVVDTHGEYPKLLGKLAQKNPFQIIIFTLRHGRAGFDEFKIPVSGLSAEDFNHFLPFTEAQNSAIAKILEILDDKYTGDEKDYSLDDVIAAVDQLTIPEFHEGTVAATKRKLKQIKRMFGSVFDKYGTDVNRMVAPGQVTIVDASLAPQGVRRSVVSYLSKELLDGRINKVNEFGSRHVENELLFVVEEAHNYSASNLVHSCKYQLGRLASEGRKFGIGLCVISQKPSKIDEDILSQCNTGIYMHITNPNDKTHIKRSFECINEDIIRDLDSLDVGECIIAGAVLDVPFALCTVDRIDVKKEKKFEFKTPVEKKVGGSGHI